MNFVGLKRPEFDDLLVELETTGGEVVDLYNEHRLRATILDADGLAFEFVSLEFVLDKARWLVTDRSRLIVVRFRAVRNLRVEQPSDWAPEESKQIEYLLIRRIGPWPRVVFKAGGLDYEFDCAEIFLDVAKPCTRPNGRILQLVRVPVWLVGLTGALVLSITEAWSSSTRRFALLHGPYAADEPRS